MKRKKILTECERRIREMTRSFSARIPQCTWYRKRPLETSLRDRKERTAEWRAIPRRGSGRGRRGRRVRYAER